MIASVFRRILKKNGSTSLSWLVQKSIFSNISDFAVYTLHALSPPTAAQYALAHKKPRISETEQAIDVKLGATLVVLVLKLPDSLTGVTKYHEDFVRCEEANVADTVKGLMQQQWTSLVMPGQKVKVKIKDKLVSAVIENCHFISKLSFDSLYFYATAKVDLRLSESDQLYRECQVRELIL